MSVKNLTPKQKRILDFVINFYEENDYAPSLEEIANHFKRSIPTIHQYIEALNSKGFLEKVDKVSRGIKPQKTTVEIPLLGFISAGEPIEAISNPELIKIPRTIVSPYGFYYALKVEGSSMIDEGIFDGDLVIIRKQETAENGQNVVAIVDNNQATLKRIYKDKGHIRLQPANQMMFPIYRKEVEVRGVVVKIIRDFSNKTQSTSLKQKNVFVVKKRVFLESIKSVNPKSQNKYKRVAVSPIRYAGGKSLAVGHVIELLPDNIKKVVSPFFGGGSIEIAMSKYLDLEVIGYDIFDILCNYWKFQIEKPRLLYENLRKLKPDKITFEKIRLILNNVWRKKLKLDPITLAVYYVYNFNLSYGPGFMGWSSNIYLNKEKYKRMIEKIRDFDPQNLKVECADFQEVIKNHPNDFLYCDPPYYIGEGSKMFKGIYPMRNIPVHHNGFKHEILRNLLLKHKGGFVLSYNNCHTIREYYKGLQQFFPSWQYTMGQGETRIGLNRKNGNGSHVKESHEILIYSSPRSNCY